MTCSWSSIFCIFQGFHWAVLFFIKKFSFNSHVFRNKERELCVEIYSQKKPPYDYLPMNVWNSSVALSIKAYVPFQCKWNIAQTAISCVWNSECLFSTTQSVLDLWQKINLAYRSVLSKWEFFIKMRASYLLSPSFITRGRMGHGGKQGSSYFDEKLSFW